MLVSVSRLFYGGKEGKEGSHKLAFGYKSSGNTMEETQAFLVLSYFVPSPLSRHLAKAGCT
jgi:hypothetical protein